MNYKKFFFDFYLYYPIFIIVILFASCLCLQICPTTIYVKLFVTISLCLLVVGMITYGIMQIKNKLWTFLFILIMFIAFGIMGYNQAKSISEEKLFDNYRMELYSYVGVPYDKGFELKTKIDEYGLVFAPMRHAMVKTGIVSLNVPLITSGVTAIYKDYRNNIEKNNEKFFYKIPLTENYLFENGDVFMSNGKVYIYVSKIVNNEIKECLITTGPYECVNLIGFKKDKDKNIYNQYMCADDIIKKIDNNCVYKWKIVNYK